jgi:hypothetical protein
MATLDQQSCVFHSISTETSSYVGSVIAGLLLTLHGLWLRCRGNLGEKRFIHNTVTPHCFTHVYRIPAPAFLLPFSPRSQTRLKSSNSRGSKNSLPTQITNTTQHIQLPRINQISPKCLSISKPRCCVSVHQRSTTRAMATRPSHIATSLTKSS